MAEFCLDCWNKMNGTNESEYDYIISDDLDYCEGCGEWKHVIVIKREFYHIPIHMYFTFLIKTIYYLLCLIWKLLSLPYLLYTYLKSKKKPK